MVPKILDGETYTVRTTSTAPCKIFEEKRLISMGVLSFLEYFSLTWELVTVLVFWVDRDKLQSYVRSKHENYNMRGTNVKFIKLY